MHLLLIHSMTNLESPRISRWSSDLKEARTREAHNPKSSALEFVPCPQFKYQLVVLFGCDLKNPPAPQFKPEVAAAPSKHASVYPSVREISQLLGVNVLNEEGCQWKEAQTLWATACKEGECPSKITLFLSFQICQLMCTARLGGFDF